jgi:hypothetical protein
MSFSMRRVWFYGCRVPGSGFSEALAVGVCGWPRRIAEPSPLALSGAKRCRRRGAVVGRGYCARNRASEFVHSTLELDLLVLSEVPDNVGAMFERGRIA